MPTTGVEPVLCYIDDGWAYFTTQMLASQWGEDWHRAPYEHNAGRPFEASRSYTRYDRATRAMVPESDYTDGVPNWTITRVAWDGPFETPADRAGGNSQYSVRDINAGAIAWLSPSRYQSGRLPHLVAGTTLSEFVRLVTDAGGGVYQLTEVARLQQSPSQP